MPGLNHRLLGVQAVPAVGADGTDTGITLIRLPRLYEALNSALEAQENQAKRADQHLAARRPYSWDRALDAIRDGLLDLATKMLETLALRTRIGTGFMGLA